MNEDGFVIQMMMFVNTEYPAPDSRPCFGILEC